MNGNSYPLKNNKINIAISEGDKLKYCTFTGSTMDILIGLIFLLNKHKTACSVLNKNFKENKELNKYYKSVNMCGSKCEFLNYEIVWIRNRLYLPENFHDNMKKCLKATNKNFIIVPLGIELPEGNHSNYIIYDKILNEVERFEPHGHGSPIGFDYNANGLDNKLTSIFTDINHNVKYVSPKDFLPKISFQMLDTYERNQSKIGDPGGFCALWSIWYVDMRLTYHNSTRNELVKEMITVLKKKNISFKNLIRNYAKNIMDIRDGIFSNAGIDVNDWLNDQYTAQQSDTIIDELIVKISNIEI